MCVGTQNKNMCTLKILHQKFGMLLGGSKYDFYIMLQNEKIF